MDFQLFVLCLLQLTVCSMFTIISPFYPQRAEAAGISIATIGVLFSLNPIGVALACLPTGYYLKEIGKRRGILWSLGMISASTLLIGLVDFCDYTWFLVLSIVSMLLCGLASGVFFTIITAVVSSKYSATLQVAIMYIELSAGVGLISGPAFGSLFYYLGGYFLPFLVYCLFFAGSLPVVYFLLGPDRAYIEKNKDLNAGGLAMEKKILLDLGAYALLMFGFGINSPVMSLHLMSYGLSTEAAAGLSLTGTCAYMVCSPIVSKLPRSVNFKLTMTLGLFLFSVGYFAIGPARPLPSSLILIVAGLVLAGLSFAMVYIPCLPSMIHTATIDLGLHNDDKLSDSLSSLMNLASALGEICGPVLGGLLVQVYGYEVTYGVVSVIGLSYFFIYYTFAYKTSSKRSSEFKQALLELKEIKTLRDNSP
jgi:MFS family permease